MIRAKYGLPLLLLACLIGIFCYVVSACVSRNMQAEATTKQECKIVSVSDVGSYNTVLIVCPEKSYRCFRYTVSSYSSSISCVPTGR